jgi:hypothetical protein
MKNAAKLINAGMGTLALPTCGLEETAAQKSPRSVEVAAYL